MIKIAINIAKNIAINIITCLSNRIRKTLIPDR